MSLSSEHSAEPSPHRSVKTSSGLSTGFKMLVILMIALFPLGLIAVFASRESAHVNRLRHEAEAVAAATTTSVILTDAFRPIAIGLRGAVDRMVERSPSGTLDRAICIEELGNFASAQGLVEGAALLDPSGRLLCRTAGYSNHRTQIAIDEYGYQARLSSGERLLRISIIPSDGKPMGIAEIPISRLAHLARGDSPGRVGLMLRQGSQVVALDVARRINPLDEIIHVAAPVAHGQLSLEMRMPAAQISPIEILMILLPILTWAAGAIVGWIVVDRLLLRPLAQMQRAVTDFGVGTGPFRIPRMRTPAQEIRKLGEAFAAATEAVTRHEAELADALAKQKRLTREIHHRVKNNLQVVSSLMSLHARGISSPEVMEAYASIQRRVDALALVHRNHFADLDETIGIPLRSLISEIASNLRASGGQTNTRAGIMLNVIPASVGQDIAVPVAFLITEIVDLAMLCDTEAEISITLALAPDHLDRAILSVQSDALALEGCLAGPRAEQFQRIANGLARQLRSTLEHDIAAGRYSVSFPIRVTD